MKEKKEKPTIDLVEEVYKRLKEEVKLLDEEADSIKNSIDTLDLDEIAKKSKKVKALLNLIEKSSLMLYIFGKKHIDYIKKEHFGAK